MEDLFKYGKIRFFVLVPVYKVEKYIRVCIESVLCQTYPNFELILVDDGSPDNSGKICDEYALKDERISVIHQKNMGLIAARQTAIKYVQRLFSLSGATKDKNIVDINKTFIVHLDSDDYLKKEALEMIYNTIQEYNCDMVIYGFERVLNGKIVIPYDEKNGYMGVVENKEKLYNIVFNNSEYNSLCRKAIAANLLSKIDYNKYFYISHGEDLLQSLAYYRDCKRVYFLNKSLYNYTVNPQSITHTSWDKNFKIDFTVRQLVYEFLLSENVFTEDDWKKYRTYCIWLLTDSILKIAKFPVDFKQKIQYYDQIWKSEYFQKYIYEQVYNRKSLGKLEKIYILFKKNIYWPILFIGDVYKRIGR